MLCRNMIVYCVSHAGHTGTKSVGKISWFVGLPKVKASLRLTVGLPVDLGLKHLLWTRIGLKIYGRHLSQGGDGELEGVSRNLGDAVRVREGLRGCAPGMGRGYGPSGRTARVGGWDGSALLGAVPLTVCSSDLQRTSCVSTIKPVWTSQRKSRFNHKISSDLKEKVVFPREKTFRTSQRTSCVSTTKSVRTSQRKSTRKNISDLTENVLCFNHKNQFGPQEKVVFQTENQFGPHRESLVSTRKNN
jgi:hypothetical protein